MKLEWRKIPLRFRFADSEFGQYRIVGRAGVTRKLHVESCDGQCLNQDCDFHTVATAQQACQSDYDARVAAIALANGYVKLANDDVVVKRGTLNALIDDHCADCTFDSLEIHDCDNCDLKPIRDRLNEVGK